MRNFFNVGFRLVRENWFFSLLNMVGISIGITGIMLLFVFIESETSFDKFQKDHSKIFRLTSVFIYNSIENRFALNSGYLDDALVADVQGVSYSTAFQKGGASSFYIGGKRVFANLGIQSDQDFFKVFGFTILSGSEQFDNINDIVLTRKLALQFFGEVDVAGRIVDLKTDTGTQPLMVSAVIEDMPRNSSIQFDYVVRGSGTYWDSQFSTKESPGNTLHIYFKTAQEEDLSGLQSKVDRAFEKFKYSAKDYLTPVQRLEDIHFNSNNQFELSPGGNGDYMTIFIFILIGFALVTIVNSNNVNSSQFFNRLKEIGVRKLLGCDKYNLAGLFMIDSVFKILLCTFFSGIMSYLILLEVDLSIFAIDPSSLTNPRMLTRIASGAIMLGLMGGIYPAIKASVIMIIKALKGKLLHSREWTFSIRNSVVIFQIFTAATMLSLTLTVLRQIDYLDNKPLGYDRNNLIYFFIPEHFSTLSWKSFRDRLANETVFSSTSANSNLLFQNLPTAYFRGEGSNFQAHWFKADAKFFETMQIKVLAGKGFTPQSSQVHEVVLNDRARQEFGKDLNPIGTTVDTWFGEFQIVGIINDFHFRDFNSQITPLVVVLEDEYNWTITARFTPGKHKEALEAAQKIWSSFNSEESLSYQFFDDTFNRMLEREHQTKIIVIIFTIISGIVTAIGLTGLIGYMATQCRQEIAIRKVLGSTVWQIIMIFVKRFGFLASVGFILSLPVMLWLSEKWLSNFAFKISGNVSDIVYPFVTIAVLTIGVISRQAIAAAIKNPVHVLRNE